MTNADQLLAALRQIADAHIYYHEGYGRSIGPEYKEVARSAIAAFEAGQKEETMTSERGWVIERGDSPPHSPTYWAGPEHWSQAHLDAVRFSRKEDAERVACKLGQGYHQVCEHGWATAQPSPPSSAAARQKEAAATMQYKKSAGNCEHNRAVDAAFAADQLLAALRPFAELATTFKKYPDYTQVHMPLSAMRRAAEAIAAFEAGQKEQMVTETHTEGPCGGPYKTTTFVRPAEPRDDSWLNPDKAAQPSPPSAAGQKEAEMDNDLREARIQYEVEETIKAAVKARDKAAQPSPPSADGMRTLTGDEAVAEALAHSAQADGCIDRALAVDAARRLRARSAPPSAEDEALIKLLRDWADVLDIPSGDFVKDDLRAAADRLAALSRQPDRDAVIEECARIADDMIHPSNLPFSNMSAMADCIARRIRALKSAPTQESKG